MLFKTKINDNNLERRFDLAEFIFKLVKKE